MKTAEEWIQIYNKLDNKNPRMNGWIQQIQQDARYSALSGAAEEANNYGKDLDNFDEITEYTVLWAVWYVRGRNDATKRVIALRDKKES